MQMWHGIVYLQYLSTRDAKFCFLCLRKLICNSTACAVGGRARQLPPLNGCESDALLNAAVQNV